MENSKNKAKGRHIETEEAFRSLGKFFSWVENKVSTRSQFREHMARGRVEFLRGIRSLIDKRIEDLERGQDKGTGRKASRIKVE